MADTQELDLLDLSGLTYYDQLIKEYIGNADVKTVGGHSVLTDVPANAVFTDTTYSPVTDSTSGLMTPTQKARLDEVTKVGISQIITSGTKIATVTIDNIPTDIYAPESTVVTEETVSGWGFTKNTGTLTGVTMNGSEQSVTSGVVNLGTVITEHQDISGKVDNTTTVNGKALSSNITLSASDVGALPDTTNIPTITDTYSATSSDGMSGKAVSSAISSAISGVTQFDYEVVTSLPATGVKGKIYLIASSESKTQNIYDEYLWINNAWEKIGSTQVDLSNYYTKTEVDTELGKKVDVVTGKGLSTNDYTTAEKTKLSGIAENATSVTETTVTGWGFTKNAGTVTSVKVNGAEKTPTNGVVDIGTVVTDVSGKADKATTLSGYGITDAKINNGVITLGTDTITPLTSSSKITSSQLSFATQAQIAALFS